jgi:hypothetical protein
MRNLIRLMRNSLQKEATMGARPKTTLRASEALAPLLGVGWSHCGGSSGGGGPQLRRL